MEIKDLVPAEGSTKNRKRVGRGPASGHGKTAGRGMNGQLSRSGGGKRPGFEGGQMPLTRRIPKRGFTNIFAKEYAIVNVSALNAFEDGATVTTEALLEKGLIKKALDGVKVLGGGELQKKLTVSVDKVTDSAKEKIEAIGGKVEVK